MIIKDHLLVGIQKKYFIDKNIWIKFLSENVFFLKIILQRAPTQEKYTFTAKRWLAKDEGDGKIEIDINIDENEKLTHKDGK